MELEFDNIYELEALARTLNHVKFFGEEPLGDPFMASPLLAAVHRRVIWSIIDFYEKDLKLPGKAVRWLEWLEWHEDSYEEEAVVGYVLGCSDWGKSSRDEKLEILKNCCAPFELNEVQLGSLFNKIEGQVLFHDSSDNECIAQTDSSRLLQPTSRYVRALAEKTNLDLKVCFV